jgi:hypothetical protein
MEMNPSTITLTPTPTDARLQWRCGQNSPQEETGAATVQCSESEFSLAARSEGYEDIRKIWQLTPGQSYNFSFALPPATSSLVKNTGVCSTEDLTRTGWKKDGEWFVASKAIPVPCGGLAGTLEFTLRVPRGILAKPVQWELNPGAANALTFQLDKKTIHTASVGSKDISRYCEVGALRVRVLIGSTSVLTFTWARDGWVLISTELGDYRNGKFVFSKDVRLKAFSYKE